MRVSMALSCFALLLVPVLAACAPDNYVENNGTDYYDANGLFVDSTPTDPYTKSGYYISNPDETTNTRDNRGSRPPYGQDPEYNEDQNPPPHHTVIYTNEGGTVVETTE